MDKPTTVETITYRVSFSRAGFIIDGQIYAELDADEATLWDGAHGDTLLATFTRTPSGMWKLASVPCGRWNATKRFTSIEHGVEHLGHAERVVYRVAVCRCGTASECD